MKSITMIILRQKSFSAWGNIANKTLDSEESYADLKKDKVKIKRDLINGKSDLKNSLVAMSNARRKRIDQSIESRTS